MPHALFPLGGMEKPEIRRIARELGLKTADKVESQEICFVPGNDYKAFLRQHLGERNFTRAHSRQVGQPIWGRMKASSFHHRTAQRASRGQR